ncbi:hypothetical protein GCM10009868_02940 [Terrabacter aerolatus]|uniref:Uncharacterized protein n=2 Tax=Terrabacter aerolatus TaxID=422442 RepID=A0A512D5K1_9MICO|nr:hypothetical protein TAE01_35550 [Terrabacter aerolatus]
MLAQLRSIGSRNVCLPAGAVPGGPWVARGGRTYRTGASGSTSEAITRARAVRSVTSLRGYQEVGRADLFLQVIPFASPEDARAAVTELRSLPRTMPKSKGVSDVGEMRTVTPPPVTGAGHVEAAELPFVLDGEHARQLTLWCAAGQTVVVGALGGRAEAVRWPQLAEIVEAQVASLG